VNKGGSFLLKKEKGYILLDVMLAVLIIAISFAFMLEMFGQAGKSNKMADNRSLAYNFAQERLEALKGDPTALDATSTLEINQVTFTRVTSVKNSSFSDSLQQYTVVVSWQEKDSQKKTITKKISLSSWQEKK